MTAPAIHQIKPAPALLPYQQRWAAAVERPQIREKARCVGISHAAQG